VAKTVDIIKSNIDYKCCSYMEDAEDEQEWSAITKIYI